MKGFATALCFVLASLSLPLSSAAVAATPAATASYVELGDYLRGEAEIEAWYEALYRLRDNFDQICGDTFCEGDYSNIQALRLRCSVDSASGLVGRCLWSFAASNEEIDPATGAIRHVVDLKGLRETAGASGMDSVLNGIAWDGAHKQFYLTGKQWPVMFAGRFSPP